ncbi:hypothetical protein [Streptomyces griseofuscus]|uniref:hypothetical protein n=1 Tax=Streptomyces griseofuscus TaxID=146922 RepID=UPI000ACA2B22|nr:hypothetical protein [Streptomyces griseofuscus]
MAVQCFDYDQAAEKLGCKKSYLERHISTLPHIKIGESTVFCDCDLRLILQMFTVIPESVRAALQPNDSEKTEPVPTLRSIKPSGRRTAAK